jgi:hypothetical protein
MKRLTFTSSIAVGLLGLFGLAFSGTAAAQCPVTVTGGPNFTGTGSPITVTGFFGIGASCEVTAVGSIDSCGVLEITAFDIDPGESACNSSTAQNLPWSGQVTSPTTAEIYGVSIATSIPFVTCSASTVTVGLDQPSTIDFDGAQIGICTAQGQLELDTNFTVTQP